MNNTEPEVVQNEAQLFLLGQVVATPGALEVLEASHQTPAEFLARHARGDWGDLSADDFSGERVQSQEWFPAAEQLHHS